MSDGLSRLMSLMRDHPPHQRVWVYKPMAIDWIALAVSIVIVIGLVILTKV